MKLPIWQQEVKAPRETARQGEVELQWKSPPENSAPTMRSKISTKISNPLSNMVTSLNFAGLGSVQVSLFEPFAFWRERVNGFVVFQQLVHGFAHRQPDIHVGLSVAVVMTI